MSSIHIPVTLLPIRWRRKLRLFAAIAVGSAGSLTNCPERIAFSQEVSGTPAARGANLPQPKSKTLGMIYRNRKLLIVPDESAMPGASEVYFVEPPLFLVARSDGAQSLPAWMLRVREMENGMLRVLVKVVIEDRNLLDAAEMHVRVSELDQLKLRSQQRNSGQPLQIAMRSLPVSKIRIEFVDLSNESEVIAFGEADVSRTRQEREIWIQMEPGVLQKIIHLHNDGLLGMCPWYSYPGIAMSRAAIVNMGKAEILDRLKAFLASKNLTGDGDVKQTDIDEFIRSVRGNVWSKIVATDPTPAGFLVNNATQLTTSVFEPASLVPFQTGLGQADQVKLAEHLGALGWLKTSADTWESVDEQMRSVGTGSSVGGSVAGSIGTATKSVGVQLGFTSSKEQVEATLKRLGLQMQRSNTHQGWEPAFVQKFKVKQGNVEREMGFAAEVSIGMGPVNGFFNGEPFAIEQFSPEAVREWSGEYINTLGTIERSRQPVQNGFSAANYGNAAIMELVSQIQTLRTIADKVDELKGAMDGLNDKLKASAKVEGKIAGIRESLGPLVGHHLGIDEEEARDMQGRGQGQVGAMVGPLEKLLTDANAESRVKQAAHKNLHRELADMIEAHAKVMVEMIARFNVEDSMELAKRIREAFPTNPTFAQKKIITEVQGLLEKRETLRTEIASLLNNWKDQEQQAIHTDKASPGSVQKSVEIIDTGNGVESRSAWLIGKKEGLQEFGVWYCGTSGSVHDSGEAKDIENWWNGSHIQNAQRDIDTESSAVNAKDLAGSRKRLADMCQATEGHLESLKQTGQRLKEAARNLSKVESDLDQATARLLTSISNL